MVGIITFSAEEGFNHSTGRHSPSFAQRQWFHFSHTLWCTASHSNLLFWEGVAMSATPCGSPNIFCYFLMTGRAKLMPVKVFRVVELTFLKVLFCLSCQIFFKCHRGLFFHMIRLETSNQKQFFSFVVQEGWSPTTSCRCFQLLVL